MIKSNSERLNIRFDLNLQEFNYLTSENHSKCEKMERMSTDFYEKEGEKQLSEEERTKDNQNEMVLETTSKEFKPSGLFTQIEDEIKNAHLRKKYRKLS
ncbi:MAG: hypothetical protein JW891_11625 [Candidatus Lokiarchaeota archaeon]|nr:hypothetical protein [Candidatus Lokiarchaeota archaeon]